MATTKQMFAEILKKLEFVVGPPVAPVVEPVKPPVVTEIYTGPFMDQIYWPNIHNNNGYGTPEKYAVAIVQNAELWLIPEYRRGLPPLPEAVAFMKDWPRFFDAAFKAKYPQFFKE